MGKLQEGSYVDECDGVHPDTLQQFYGVRGNESSRQHGQTGAGHLEEDEQHLEEIAALVGDAIHDNVRHEAVETPDSDCPFDSEEICQVFEQTLAEIKGNRILPTDYGIFPEEWETSEYPTQENLVVGKKDTVIMLPEHIWRPHAELWCQALYVLTYIQHREATLE
jgi:hypothetical protein